MKTRANSDPEALSRSIEKLLEEQFPRLSIQTTLEEETIAVLLESNGHLWKRKLRIEFCQQPEAIAGLIRCVRAWQHS